MGTIFPVIQIRGNAEERGHMHGNLLRERIIKTIDFYKRQFMIPETEILKISEQFRTSTKHFHQELSIEIESIAKSADVDPLWIYALNGRTELLNLNPAECTTLAFKEKQLMGQNWDWDMEMEELAVILDIENENGHRILTMTEPGMIGKIGMNNKGVGVCINFMSIENFHPGGIPLHVLLRAIMETDSFAGARSVVADNFEGKVCNILISDKHGHFENMEIAGAEFFSVPVNNRFVHTNHFLTKVDYDLKLFPNSTSRYNRAQELLKEVDMPTIDRMKQILKDRGNDVAPICRKRFSHPLLSDDTSITVTTIIMDLKKLEFHITLGNPFENPFSVFSLGT